jgi:hypothetical protein
VDVRDAVAAWVTQRILSKIYAESKKEDPDIFLVTDPSPFVVLLPLFIGITCFAWAGYVVGVLGVRLVGPAQVAAFLKAQGMTATSPHTLNRDSFLATLFIVAAVLFAVVFSLVTVIRHLVEVFGVDKITARLEQYCRAGRLPWPSPLSPYSPQRETTEHQHGDNGCASGQSSEAPHSPETVPDDAKLILGALLRSCKTADDAPPIGAVRGGGSGTRKGNASDNIRRVCEVVRVSSDDFARHAPAAFPRDAHQPLKPGQSPSVPADANFKHLDIGSLRGTQAGKLVEDHVEPRNGYGRDNEKQTPPKQRASFLKPSDDTSPPFGEGGVVRLVARYMAFVLATTGDGGDMPLVSSLMLGLSVASFILLGAICVLHGT